jgi:hypothetical protein
MGSLLPALLCLTSATLQEASYRINLMDEVGRISIYATLCQPHCTGKTVIFNKFKEYADSLEKFRTCRNAKLNLQAASVESLLDNLGKFTSVVGKYL